MCWKVDDDDSVTYSKDCSTAFLYTKFNRIMQAGTEKCVAVDGNKVVMSASCKEKDSVFVPVRDSLKNPYTKMCIQPTPGQDTPKEGETLVMTSSCGESRMSHRFVPALESSITFSLVDTKKRCTDERSDKGRVATVNLCAQKCHGTSIMFNDGHLKSARGKCECMTRSNKNQSCSSKNDDPMYQIYKIGTLKEEKLNALTKVTNKYTKERKRNEVSRL